MEEEQRQAVTSAFGTAAEAALRSAAAAETAVGDAEAAIAAVLQAAAQREWARGEVDAATHIGRSRERLAISKAAAVRVAVTAVDGLCHAHHSFVCAH